jgi:hypothetical protein
MIPNAYNPTDKDLEIRFSFAGGQTTDTSFVEYVKIMGYANNTIDNGLLRAVTASYPAVLRDNYEPILMRDDNGLNLNGGTLTIGADTGTAQVLRTLEMWVKPTSSDNPLIFSVTGTKYRNGVGDSSLPVGEWSLIHWVLASDSAGGFTVSGSGIIGQVVYYDTPLSAGNISHIYKSYTGRPVLAFADPGVIGMSEPATPVAVYAHDWSIDGGGG